MPEPRCRTGRSRQHRRGVAVRPNAEVVDYERSPLDVLRVLLFAVGTLAIVLATKYLRKGVDGLEDNLTSLLEAPWSWARLAVDVALIATVAVAGLAVLIVPLFTRRFRLFGYVVVAGFVNSVLIGAIVRWLGLSGTSGNDVSAEAAAAGRQRRRGGRLAPGRGVRGDLPVRECQVAPRRGMDGRCRGRAAADRGLGHLHARDAGAAGRRDRRTAVLLAFGRPTTQPRLGSIIAALRCQRHPGGEMHPASVDARGSVPYFENLEDGSGVFAKVLGENQPAADLLFRIYRAIHLRNVGDERPFSSLRRTVEHEALVALQARDVGVRTPRLRCVAPVGSDSFLLCYDMIDGRSLDGVDEDRLTDDVLHGLWEQVALLRRYRIAHRDLRLANVFLSDTDEPWLIDFGFSEVAASEALLDADVAQLVASLAVAVGAERAVIPAIDSLGPEAVAAALGRLQPAALSGATQTELKSHRGLLDEVRAEIEQRCEVEEPPLEPVTRFGPKQIFTLVMLAAVFYFLIPQFADLPGIVTQVQDADWAWLPLILLASAFTYLAASMAMLGSVPSRLPIGPTTAAQVASSFASKVAPAGLGGMAMNVRYMQRQGVDTTVATSAVGLNAGAGIVGHITLVGVFLVWAGRDAFGSISSPSPRALLIRARRRGRRRRSRHARAVDTQARGRQAVPHPGQGGPRSDRRPHHAEQGRPAAGGHDPGDAQLRRGVQLLGSRVRHRPAVRVDRCGLPDRVGDRDRSAHPGRPRCCGGRARRWPDRCRCRQGTGGSAVFLFRLATFWIPILPGYLAFSWLRHTERL